METLLPLSTTLRINTLHPMVSPSFLQRSGSANKFLPLKRLLQGKQEGNVDRHDAYMDCPFSSNTCTKSLLHVTEELLLEMPYKGFLPDVSTLSTLMLCYANKELIDVYATSGHFDLVSRILHQVRLRNHMMLPAIYAQTISCFGKKGELELMEIMLTEMIAMGFSVDSVTQNAFVIYSSNFGSVAQMEVAYARLKSSRILIEEEGIRAVSSAYIRERKFYSLGKFLEDVGLGRRNVGNLLWNLLLLSFAANFKMKSLQRTFVRMVEGGFHPDLTTFNIRALAFAKMSLFWDLHLSIEHMQHEGVVPDLVTYGCIVDAYLERRLGKNLEFALSRLDTDTPATILTDGIVFDAMGKGDFHLSAEAFLEFKDKRDWTYKQLIKIYQKKKFRSNQVFWNY
ncbi:pentatricopeptide repeat-containing protein At3g42630 isoform X2 [Coffea arabica]|uniref:Pentatricopeptide repeat-containing protein At3g42630 isoform X2 n=1 Tax=Coffea arabica TaxID=13443 RepID=A0A6P6SHV0_COFAR|nr:pentatricopeptide repeat-containing protein At3g42630-like isoform X2 [Coffea arabica]